MPRSAALESHRLFGGPQNASDLGPGRPESGACTAQLKMGAARQALNHGQAPCKTMGQHSRVARVLNSSGLIKKQALCCFMMTSLPMQRLKARALSALGTADKAMGLTLWRNATPAQLRPLSMASLSHTLRKPEAGC